MKYKSMRKSRGWKALCKSRIGPSSKAAKWSDRTVLTRAGSTTNNNYTSNYTSSVNTRDPSNRENKKVLVRIIDGT